MFKVKHGNDILTVYDVKIGYLQYEPYGGERIRKPSVNETWFLVYYDSFSWVKASECELISKFGGILKCH